MDIQQPIAQDSCDAEASLRNADLCKVLLSARADVASQAWDGWARNGWGWLGMAGNGSCMIGTWNWQVSEWRTSQTHCQGRSCGPTRTDALIFCVGGAGDGSSLVESCGNPSVTWNSFLEDSHGKTWWKAAPSIGMFTSFLYHIYIHDGHTHTHIYNIYI
jgi:hypothetical protein